MITLLLNGGNVMKCVIYTRVSTDRQESKNQLEQLKTYVGKEGWETSEIITDTCSGASPADERKGLKKVFRKAHRKEFDVLLFWSLDRFSREGSRKTLEYLTRLDDCKVKWHSYTEPYISSLGIFSDAIIAILSALAKQERIRISERTKAGLARVRKYKKLGRPAVSKETVFQAVKYRNKGFSYSQIAEAMNISKSRAYQLCSR
jgi:putative DNA-invertase from lambdoid prophage Rac